MKSLSVMSIVLLTVASLIVLAAPASALPSRVTIANPVIYTSTCSGLPGSPNTYSVSYSVADNSSSVLVVLEAYAGGGFLSNITRSMSFDGRPLTFIMWDTTQVGPEIIEAWYMKAPPTGSHSLSIDWGTSTTGNLFLAVATALGVDQVNPIVRPAAYFAVTYDTFSSLPVPIASGQNAFGVTLAQPSASQNTTIDAVGDQRVLAKEAQPDCIYDPLLAWDFPGPLTSGNQTQVQFANFVNRDVNSYWNSMAIVLRYAGVFVPPATTPPSQPSAPTLDLGWAIGLVALALFLLFLFIILVMVMSSTRQLNEQYGRKGGGGRG